MLKLGILGSGKGSNFQAILDAIDRGDLQAQVVLVLSDIENAGILEIARKRNIPAEFVKPGNFRHQMGAEVEQAMAERVRAAGAELIVLAGFMRILKADFLGAFPKRIINIHPSLLPKFRGLAAWKQALEADEAVTGCTVHHVDAGVDTGEIIAQVKVSILPGDTAETLHARIQKEEHRLLPDVIARHFTKS